jgi:hypothetical protein
MSMAKRKPLVTPKPKCHVPDCAGDASYGFRETIDVSHSTSKVREFIMGDVPNWCKVHDAEQRPIYATKHGDYIKF